jgi:hypothetical protein
MASNRSTNADMFDLADWARDASDQLEKSIESAVSTGLDDAIHALNTLRNVIDGARETRDLPVLRQLKEHWNTAAAE